MSTTTAAWPCEQMPLREDGTAWPYALLASEGTEGVAILSDTVTELVAHVIPGYPEDHDSALIARYQTAVATANDFQRMLVAEAVVAEKIDLEELDEDTLNVLFGNRAVPVDGEVVQHWDAEPPLVLIETDYEPFTGRTPITGNVLWLDPSDEAVFMRSLTNLGVISFMTQETE